MMALAVVFSANAMILTVNGEGDVDERMELTITDYEDDGFDLMFSEIKGTLLLGAGNSTLTVLLERSNVAMKDQICCGQCISSNEEAAQEVVFNELTGVQNWFIHCPYVAGQSSTITYEFHDGADVKTLVVTFDGTGQGLDNVTATASHMGVYTIFGQQLRADNSTEGLPSGMYIVNGKKTIIK